MSIETREISTPAGLFRVSVEPDPYADSPRTWSNLSTFTITHSHDADLNGLGEIEWAEGWVSDALDADNAVSVRAFCRYLRFALGAHTVLPLYNGTDGPSPGDPTSTDDLSGVIGVAWVTESEAQAELELNPEFDVAGCVRTELRLFNAWRAGAFVSYLTERFVPACSHGHGDEWVHVDSLSGIIDLDDTVRYALGEAYELIGHMVEVDAKAGV